MVSEVKIERVRRKWTQYDMADKLGISASGYRQKEAGLIGWTQDEMVEIAKMFEWDLKDVNENFFGGKFPDAKRVRRSHKKV